MKRLLISLVLSGVVSVGALAQPAYYEVPDVPTDLPGIGPPTRLPWDIVENNVGLYSIPVSLPFNTPVNALHRLNSGNWLLSVGVPSDLPAGGITWDPRDVLEWDGTAVGYFAFFNGAAAGIPAGANVDAAFLDPGGATVISLDIPTDLPTGLGMVTFDPADLVRYNGLNFDAIPYFDASAVGIPSTTNLTAADRRGLRIIFSLDVLTTAGAATFAPGELISWNGGALSVFDPQPGWPVARDSRVNALTFDPNLVGINPGAIAPSLTVNRLGAAQLRLNWVASDCTGGEDTGIYQGTIASLHLAVPAYDHTLIDCSDAFPFLEEDIPLPGIDSYFIVAPHNNTFGEEGSYGFDYIGGVMTDRPVGLATCEPVQMLGCP